MLIELLLPTQLSHCASSVVGINSHFTPRKSTDAMKQPMSCKTPPPMTRSRPSRLSPFSSSQTKTGVSFSNDFCSSLATSGKHFSPDARKASP